MRFSSWRHLQHKTRKRTRNPSGVSPRKTSSVASSRWVDTGCRWPRRASSWPPVIVNCSLRCCKGQVWQTSGLDGCHQRVWQSPGWATVLPLHIKPSTTMQGLSSCRHLFAEDAIGVDLSLQTNICMNLNRKLKGWCYVQLLNILMTLSVSGTVTNTRGSVCCQRKKNHLSVWS